MELFVETSALGSDVWITDMEGEFVTGIWLSDTEWNDLLELDVTQWIRGLGFQLDIGSEWIRHGEWLRSVGLTSPAYEAQAAAVDAMIDRALLDEAFSEWLETGVQGPVESSPFSDLQTTRSQTSSPRTSGT